MLTSHYPGEPKSLAADHDKEGRAMETMPSGARTTSRRFDRRSLLRCIAPLLLAIGADVAAEPVGYVADPGPGPFQRLMQLDLATGTIVPIGEMGVDGAFVRVLAFAPEGTLYGIDEVEKRLLRIDPATGTAEPVVDLMIVDPENWLVFVGMTVDACGRFLAVGFRQFDEPHWQLMEIDPESGIVFGVPLASPVVLGLAAHGEILYADTPRGLARIDPVSGAVTPVSHQPPEQFVSYLAFDGTGELWGYVIPRPPPPIPIPTPPKPSLLYRIDRLTGAGAEIASFEPFYSGLAIAPAPGVCGGGPPPLPIPTASRLGLVALAVLLAAAAAAALARSRSPSV